MGRHSGGEEVARRETEMEGDTEALPGCRSSATLDLSECARQRCGHRPQLPALPQTPGAVMRCDSG